MVVRKKVKVGDRPRDQLKLLHVEEVLYNYQVIATNSNLSAEDVWRFYNKRAFEPLMFAYNLMNFFKEEVMNQNKVKEMIQGRGSFLYLADSYPVEGVSF